MITLLLTLLACTDNQRTKVFGGDMTVLLFVGAYAAWCFAYLMEP